MTQKVPLDTDLGVSILDAVSGRFVAVLRVALDRACPRSPVLDLFDIFGREAFLKFLDIFQGMTLDVPTRGKVEDCMRQVAIYLALKRTKASQRPKAIRALAQKYGIPAGDVRTIFVELDNLFENEGYLLP
jgi:hypothetical protein